MADEQQVTLPEAEEDYFDYNDDWWEDDEPLLCVCGHNEDDHQPDGNCVDCGPRPEFWPLKSMECKHFAEDNLEWLKLNRGKK